MESVSSPVMWTAEQQRLRHVTGALTDEFRSTGGIRPEFAAFGTAVGAATGPVPARFIRTRGGLRELLAPPYEPELRTDSPTPIGARGRGGDYWGCYRHHCVGTNARRLFLRKAGCTRLVWLVSTRRSASATKTKRMRKMNITSTLSKREKIRR